VQDIGTYLVVSVAHVLDLSRLTLTLDPKASEVRDVGEFLTLDLRQVFKLDESTIMDRLFPP
jgi:hypothetical protein